MFRDGRPPDLSGIPDFFFLLSWKKKPEPGKLTIFLSGKKMVVWFDTTADLPLIPI